MNDFSPPDVSSFGSTAPRRNWEMKARILDWDGAVAIAEQVCDCAPTELLQADHYFPAQHGRLKLRVTGGQAGQLIGYFREDFADSRNSDYHIVEVAEAETLRTLLTRTLGAARIVRKKRVLYMSAQTRIHLDQVDGLGNFFELEYVMRPEENVELARQTVEALTTAFAPALGERIATSYGEMEC